MNYGLVVRGDDLLRVRFAVTRWLRTCIRISAGPYFVSTRDGTRVGFTTPTDTRKVAARLDEWMSADFTLFPEQGALISWREIRTGGEDG